MGSHMRTPCQKACTCCFVVCWVILLAATLVCHAAVGTLVPALVDLPDNLREGFGVVFGFDSLETESANVKSIATTALAKCGVDPVVSCSNPPQPPIQVMSDTTPDVAQVNAAFARTLAQINRVTSDKYLGVEAFNGTATALTDITAQLDQVPAGSAPCSVTNTMWCGIYDGGQALHDGVSMVNAQIDTFVETKEVKDFKDGASQLVMLHALPYLMWLSMMFFTCFWFADQPACCCCTPKRPGAGCAYCVHLILWFVVFLISVIIVVIGEGTKHFAKTEKITGVFKTDPTLVELVDHIEVNYPEFYALVLEDLINGLATFLLSMTIMALLVNIIFLYGCGLCCRNGRPYYEPNNKVHDIEVGVKQNKQPVQHLA